MSPVHYENFTVEISVCSRWSTVEHKERPRSRVLVTRHEGECRTVGDMLVIAGCEGSAIDVILGNPR